MSGVTLGFIHPNTVSTGFMESVLRIASQSKVKSVLSERGCPAQMGDARNRVTAKFLKTDSDWLWFVDTDIIFKPGALDRLLAHDKPVVSANYSIITEVPANYDWRTQECAWQWDNWDVPHMRPYPKYEGLMKVDVVGAGCLLIKRSVLMNMSEAAWESWWSQTDSSMGEDVSFCTNLADAGYPIYFDADLKVLHQKTVWI